MMDYYKESYNLCDSCHKTTSHIKKHNFIEEAKILTLCDSCHKTKDIYIRTRQTSRKEKLSRIRREMDRINKR